MKEIYLIVLFIIAGIIAGYLTNTYAVRWLFKPIKKKGTFPAWDISIVSTAQKKEKLVESLTDCITESILTSEVLQEGIPDALIQKHLEQWMENLFAQGFGKQMRGLSLEKISGFEQVKKEIRSYLERLMEELLFPRMRSMLQDHSISEWITPKQISCISEQIYEVIWEEVQKNAELKEMLWKFCQEKKDITLEQLMETAEWERLEKHLIRVCLKEVVINLLSDRNKLEETLDALLQVLDVRNALEKLQRNLGEKKIGELAEEYSLDQLFTDIGKNTFQYMKTAEGRRVIRRLQKDVLEFLLSLDQPFGSLLTDDTLESLKQWIRRKVPEVLPYLSRFIRENEEELNQLIYDSIRIAAEKNNHSEWLGWLEQTIKIWMASRIQIPARLQKILEDIKEEDSDAIVEKLLDLLTQQKISELVRQYQKNKKSHAWLKLLKKYGWETLSFGASKLYGWMKEIPLSRIFEKFHINLEQLVLNQGKEWLLKTLAENSDKVAERAMGWAENKISQKQPEKYKICGQMTEEKAGKQSEKCLDWISRRLKSHKDETIAAISGYLEKSGASILDQWQKKHLDLELQSLKGQALNWYDLWMLDFQKQPVENLLKKLNTKPMRQEAVGMLSYQIRLQMDQLVHSQLEVIVSNALNRLNSDVLCAQIEELMGGQFKYLSLFGGGLGGIISVLTCWWAVPGMSVWGSPTSWSGALISLVSMGVIGIITNIIAIWMIFHPRKPLKCLAQSKFKVLRLCSQGVIVKNQKEFAENMAKYVTTELLSEENVTRLYQEQESKLTDFIQDWLFNKGMELLKDNKENFAKRGVETLLREEPLKKYLFGGLDQLGSKSIKTFLSYEKISSLFPEMIEAVLEKAEGAADEWIGSEIKAAHAVGDWTGKLDQDFQQKLFLEIGSKLAQKAETFSLKEFAVEHEAVYQKAISVSWSQDLKRKLHVALDHRLTREKTVLRKGLSEWVQGQFDRLMEEKKPIGALEIFQKTIPEWVDLLCDKKLEEGIQWTYENVIKNQIEEVFGYQEGKPAPSNPSGGFFGDLKKGVSIFGLRYIIEPIFHDAIWELKEEQLPRYLNGKKQEIQTVLTNFLKEQVYPLAVSDAVLLVFGEDYRTSLNKLMDQMAWKEKGRLQPLLRRGIHIGLNALLRMKPRFYLRMMNMDSLSAVTEKFSPELERGKKEITSHIEEGTEIICQWIWPRLEEIKIQNIVSIWDEAERKQVIRHFLRQGVGAQCALQTISPPLREAYEKRVGERTIDSLFSMKELKDMAFTSFVVPIQKEEMKDSIKKMIATEIQRFAEEYFERFPREFREELLGQLVGAGSMELREQLPSLLGDLEIYQMTRERLMALSPEEIEKTVRAFGDPIFYQLYALGAIGFLAGLNCYLAIILLFVEEWRKG